MKNQVLIFSIALNGYDKKWTNCIKSQRDYAKKNGYKYCLINKLSSELNFSESSWLKIPLIIKALENNFEMVCYLDADCMVSKKAPRVDTLKEEEKSVYLVKGYSGRFNSGVIIVKNNKKAKQFFKKVFSACDLPILKKNERVGFFGENGHIIHFAKNDKCIKEIDFKWNNTIDPMVNDYIRHYTGPMRKYYTFSQENCTITKTPVYMKKTYEKLKWIPEKLMNLIAIFITSKMHFRLLDVTNKCTKEYPIFLNK